MNAPGWVSCRLADVPAGQDWLGDRERRTLAGLQRDRRRADWQLGRWTVKTALAGWLGTEPKGVEVLAAADGAPEVWRGERRLPLSVSLSHRAGRALAVVAAWPHAIGCDLELVEPRSAAFTRAWLAAPEQRRLASCREAERALLANAFWAAKEAAAKARREGLRLDVHTAVVALDRGRASGAWSALEVRWNDGGGVTAGWWRAEGGWISVVAGAPAPAIPRLLRV